MRQMILRVALGAAMVWPTALFAQHAASPAANPYAGQQNRLIKALPDEDILALQKGEGMGLAKAAELNGYPGPSHVRTLGKELRLSDDQSAQIAAIFDRMSAAAKPLGSEMIAKEKALDALFARGEITPEKITAAATGIGEISGRLRAVHLAVHIETRALLSPDQLALYQQLRGYAAAGKHHHHPQ